MAAADSFHEVRILRLDSSHLPVFLYAAGDVVIDTGFTRAGKQAMAWMREVSPRSVVVTHHHEDHSGNVGAVAALGVPLLAHPLAIPLLRDGFRVPYYRRRIWGLPECAATTPLPAQVTAAGFTLDVHHAPGHSADMVVLHEPRRGWLFAADLFIASRPAYLRCDEDAPLILETLKSVLRLEFDTVFCAHRGVLRDGRQKLQQKAAFLEELRGKILALNERGLPPPQIARRLLGREGLIYYYSRGEFARRHFVGSFLASGAASAGAAS